MSTPDDIFFRHLCENLGFVQTATDTEGKIVFWNETAARQFGKSADEMIGRRIVEVLEPSDQAAAGDAIAAAVARGEAGELEVKHIHPTRGRRTLVLIVSPIADAQGRQLGVSASMRDISERKRLSQELAKSRRIGSLGNMAAGVAHHFNNILGGMLTSIDAVLTSDNPRELRRTLRQLSQAIGRATRITRQLETFAESENRIGEDLTTLDGVVGDYVAKLQTAAERLHVRIDARITSPLVPPRSFELHKIQPVVESLVQNALDAMPNGGTLTLEVNQEPEFGVLRITDSGCGMPDDVLDRIFEPFFTTKGELGGGSAKNIGLGLAAVHGLVSDMAGTIRIESKVGVGTTVIVRLPLVEKEPRSASVAAGAAAP